MNLRRVADHVNAPQRRAPAMGEEIAPTAPLTDPASGGLMSDQQDIQRHLGAVVEGLTALRDQMECTGYAFVAWGHALARHAEAAYLEAHGRLPGAQTTARLRKKRQALWCSRTV